MSRRERGDRSLADQLVREGRTGRRPDPFLILWRWRWELAVVAAVVALAHVVAPGVLLPVAGVVVALCAVVPVLRKPAGDRFWCIATQHRLRAGLHESDVRSWSGRAPAIVWTSAVAACWAGDVTGAPHHRYANLAVVEVVRRGPRRGSP